MEAISQSITVQDRIVISTCDENVTEFDTLSLVVSCVTIVNNLEVIFDTSTITWNRGYLNEFIQLLDAGID